MAVISNGWLLCFCLHKHYVVESKLSLWMMYETIQFTLSLSSLITQQVMTACCEPSPLNDGRDSLAMELRLFCCFVSSILAITKTKGALKANNEWGRQRILSKRIKRTKYMTYCLVLVVGGTSSRRCLLCPWFKVREKFVEEEFFFWHHS